MPIRKAISIVIFATVSAERFETLVENPKNLIWIKSFIVVVKTLHQK